MRRRRINRPSTFTRRVASALNHVAAWDWRPADDAIRASASLKSLFGIRRLRGVEQGLTLVAPGHRDRQRRMIEAAVAGGTGYSSEFGIVRPDNGRTSTIREYAEAIFDPDGEVVRLIGVDIQQPPRSNPVLALVEELASTLLAREAMRWRAFAAGLRDGKPGGDWSSEYRSRIVRLAATARTIDEFAARVHRATTTQRRSSQRHVAAVQARRAPAAGQRTNRSIRFGASGTLRRMMDRVTAAARERVSAAADPVQVLGRLCEPLPCAALIANDAGEFISVNAAASAMMGYSRRELLRISVWQITPGVNEREAETLWRVFREQHEQSGEYRVLTKTRQTIVADYYARPNVLPGIHVSLLQPARRPPSYG